MTKMASDGKSLASDAVGTISSTNMSDCIQDGSPSSGNVRQLLPQDTPLASKQPSSSLMRQLFDLRKKQMEQQKRLEESMHSSTSSLHQSKEIFSLNKDEVQHDSMPHQKSSSHGLPSPDVSSSDEQRNPLSQLQSNHMYMRTNLKAVELDPNFDENISPKTKDTIVNEISPKKYNPNIYRSPPKKKNTECLSSSGGDTQSGYFIESNFSTHRRNICSSKDVIVSSPDIDRPIMVSEKSFEDLVLEKINSGEYRTSSSDTPAPKKFLKKGTGAVRFELQPNSITEEKSKIIYSTKDATVYDEPKVKFPYLKKRVGSKRFNIKQIKLKKTSVIKLPDVVTPTERLVLSDYRPQNFSTPVHQTAASIQNRRLHLNIKENGNSLSPIVSKLPKREIEELKAFERLEELAENSSFSSNASTVNSLLQKGLDNSETSTPINSPVPRRARHENNLLLQRKLAPAIPSTSFKMGHANRDLDPTVIKSDQKTVGNDFQDYRKQRTVQFSEQGAMVMEYYVNDGNDTVSEAPNMSEASDLLNVSDLEALNELYQQGRIKGLPVSAEYVEDQLKSSFSVESKTSPQHLPYVPFSNDDEGDGDIGNQEPRRTVLHFSPPRIPPNGPSFPIWQAFGKKPAPSVLIEKKKPQQPRRSYESHANLYKHERDISNDDKSHKMIQSDEIKRIEQELQSHKVLLVAKVHELENEITTFQTKNNEQMKLKETLQREKEQLNKERKNFELTLSDDRRRMEEYFESEKNKLWREKCELESCKTTGVHTNDTLEIINLKEEILLLKNELDRRDSMHNFTQNKLKEKFKELNNQKRDVDQKFEKLSNVEKENMLLKHQIDRLKISSKTGTLQNTKIKFPAAGQLQTTTTKSVRFVNSGDLLTKKDPTQKIRMLSISDNETGNSTSDDATKAPYNSHLSKLPGSLGTEVYQESSASPGFSSSLNSSEVTLDDGSKLITYVNGNKKQILPTGAIIQEYYNGDRKETYSDKVVYVYNETSTKQTSYHDGVEELEFPNGQKEIKRPDGSVEVIFPDLSRKRTDVTGNEVFHRTDGTTVTTTASGEKVFLFPNGQREVHGAGFKRREFPDGTVKVVRANGSTQTTYPNGRVRVKDGVGNVLSDTKLGIDLTV